MVVPVHGGHGNWEVLDSQGQLAKV